LKKKFFVNVVVKEDARNLRIRALELPLEAQCQLTTHCSTAEHCQAVAHHICVSVHDITDTKKGRTNQKEKARDRKRGRERKKVRKRESKGSATHFAPTRARTLIFTHTCTHMILQKGVLGIREIHVHYATWLLHPTALAVK